MENKWKILITAPGFACDDDEPIRLMKENGMVLDMNETGTILTRDELMRRVEKADGVLLGTEKFDREVIDHAVNLRVISRYGVGMDNVDVDYAKSKGVIVRNAAGANATAVADMAVAMMLVLSRKLTDLDHQVRTGDWKEPVGIEPDGKTLGIVGFGNIGAQVARRAKGFGMKIVAYDAVYRNQALADETGVTFEDSLESLLSKADYVTLHVPHTPQTHHMIGEAQLNMMKQSVILINTARGGIIDEEALAKALMQGRIRGAGIDVFEQEPLPLDSALLGCPNTVFSPHTAADTVESARKVSLAAALNIVKALS